MIDDRALQLFPLDGKVGHTIGCVGDDFGRLRALEALEIDRLLEQRIERRRDEEIEVGDLRELAQCERRREVRIAEQAAQARVGLFAPAAGGEEPADDVVERIRLRQLRGVDIELGGELFGDPVVEKPRPGVGFDLQQLGADDRDDAALFDEIEQVLPRVLVQRGQRRMHWKRTAHVASALNGVPAWLTCPARDRDGRRATAARKFPCLRRCGQTVRRKAGSEYSIALRLRLAAASVRGLHDGPSQRRNAAAPAFRGGTFPAAISGRRRSTEAAVRRYPTAAGPFSRTWRASRAYRRCRDCASSTGRSGPAE